MTGRGRPGAEVVAVQCEVSDLMAKNAEACRRLWGQVVVRRAKTGACG